MQEANKLLEVKSLNSANESAATWRREYGTGSGLAVDPNKASDLSKALMLRQKDLCVGTTPRRRAVAFGEFDLPCNCSESWFRCSAGISAWLLMQTWVPCATL